ncbi:MAG TPA: mechanosensitive ion channel domain-containing protein [Burkholderiaceae bacterium]|nr:mechanosensitive ion channel domain-containing protein [Burkholderiaceae bacterium]
MDSFQTQLSEFWKVTKEVWDTGLFGASIGDVLVAIVIFLIFYVLRGWFRRLITAIIERWFARREGARSTQLGGIISHALSGPLQLLFVTFGIFFALQYLGPEGKIGLFGDRIVRTLVAIAIFWAVYDIVQPLGALFKRFDKVLTHDMIDWLLRGIHWAVFFVAAATILQLWGIQVAPIIAGLGLFGVAVALGAQELFRNLIGGLCILIEKQFRKGEWIAVDGVAEGTVERIGFRSTLIRRFDAAPVSVPNMKLSDAAVTNFSRMQARRISWKISLRYDSTIEQLESIRSKIEAFLKNDQAFVKPPQASLFVRIDAIADSSIDIMLYTFTVTTVWGEWLEHKERLLLFIKEVVEESGTDFAYPTQSIVVESDMPDVPAPFVGRTEAGKADGGAAAAS